MLVNSDRLEAIDLLLQKFRKPAIMLHRPYPPINLPPLRSRLGGLPLLPDAFEWPRGRTLDGESVPLHFLAQIDCAELPRVEPRMPTEGMLFFFARDDETQEWDDDEHADDHVRVIYAPKVPEQQPERHAPADLRPIKDSKPGPFRTTSFEPDWLLPEENGPAIHIAWPIVALRLDSWPDASAICETPSFLDLVSRVARAGDGHENRVVAAFARLRPPPDLDRRMSAARDELLELYTRRLMSTRVGAVVAATELPIRAGKPPGWGEIGADWFALPRDWSQGAKPFPQVGIMIDRIARVLVRQTLVRMSRRDYQEPKRLQGLAGIETAARHWIRRAQEIGLDAVPSEADAAEFSAWLNELACGRRPEAAYRLASALSSGLDAIPQGVDTAPFAALVNELSNDRPEMRSELASIFTKGLGSSVAYAAGSPQVAALIPPGFYDVFESLHLPLRPPRFSFGGWHVSARFHQMLGHASSVQEAAPYADADIPLLQLCSDDQIDMWYGDAGALTYWIKPADLAARRFDRAWGDITGH